MDLKTLTNRSFDSAALVGYCSIAHPLREPGHWRVEMHSLAQTPAPVMDIVVRDGGKARVAIDLENLIQGDRCCDTRDSVLAQNGMINLSAVSARRGGFALLFRGNGREPVWDSRVLEPGDHFACMLLRPGRYEVTNLLSNARAKVRVRYPDPRDTAKGHKLASSPFHLVVGERISPLEPHIDPGQLLVFALEAKTHLAVRLEEPDDGPAELAEWRAQRSRQALDKAFHKMERSASQ